MKNARIALAITAIAGLLFSAAAVAQTPPPATQDDVADDGKAAGGSFTPVAPPQAPKTPVPNAKQKGTPQAPAITPAASVKYDPQRQCVQSGELPVELKAGRHPVGETIVLPTNFLPSGQRVDVGIRTPYVSNLRYFAALERDDGRRRILARQDVVTRRAVASDELVRLGKLEADQTVVSIDLHNDDAGLWRKSDLYLYTCSAEWAGPASVSRVNVRLSPYLASLLACAGATILAYLILGAALKRRDDRFATYLSALDPVKLSSGPDGRGSLAKFQVLLFSLLVFALILLFMLRTGMLSELSGTILTLLGINGIGATLAKGADANRNAISAENRAWLLRRNWIQAKRELADNSAATWSDFFTTDGEFDVYRYQSFIFALVVGGAMVAAGVGQLSTFAIPDTILGIVGLSQAVYIGGKLVTRTNMADLNTAISDLRDREKKLRDTALAARQALAIGAPAGLADLVGPVAYGGYREKARDVAALFTAETGVPVTDQSLEPSIG